MKILNYDGSPCDIIVLAGQSNAFGQGLGEGLTPWVESDDILMLKNDFVTCYKRPDANTVYIDIDAQEDGYIEVAKERFDPNYNKTKGNFALTFAKMYKDKYLEKGRKVLIVFTPVGGTGFTGEHWGQNDKMYLRMVDMVDSALKLNKDHKIVAYLWHQGEHDSYEQRDCSYEVVHDYYDQKFAKLFDSVRERYGKDVPFICAGFNSDYEKMHPETNKAVIDVLKAKMQQENLTKFVEANDLSSNVAVGYNDPYHFNKASLEVLGQRYFKAYEEIISKK